MRHTKQVTIEPAILWYGLFAAITRRVGVALLALSLAACHDAPRRNPLDPGNTTEIALEVTRNEAAGAAILAWTTYSSPSPFSAYWVLRSISRRVDQVDTLDTLSGADFWVLRNTVRKVDTLAVISDPQQTSFVDTSLDANIAYVYRVSAINSGGLEVTSAESAPVPGPIAPRLAFYSDRDGVEEVYLINADGTGLINLTNSPAEDGASGAAVLSGRPAWSPDGSRIAYVSGRTGNQDIFVMNADGSNQVNITNHPSGDSFPAWSPDGTRIAFHSTRDDFNSEIYVMNADGSDVVRLTNNPGNADWAPAWSPDGSRIAWGSMQRGDPSPGLTDIYVMSADGSNQINLTNSLNWNWDPDWSPDGSKIAYTTATATFDDQAVLVMDADGSNPIQLAEGVWPDWSPDGSKIAYTDTNENEVYIMNADGSDPINITNHPAVDDWASWSPVLRQ